MGILWIVLWSSLGLIVWTHVGYPLAAALGARLCGHRPRRVVRNLADPEVGYVCGRLRIDGPTTEGLYWRYELWLRAQESRLGSITAGNGPIYAVRRTDWVDVEPWCGHDLGLPYLMVQRGRRAVYDPDAVSVEKPSRDLEDEYRRKVRMLRGAWVHVFAGRMLRGVGPL